MWNGLIKIKTKRIKHTKGATATSLKKSYVILHIITYIRKQVTQIVSIIKNIYRKSLVIIYSIKLDMSYFVIWIKIEDIYVIYLIFFKNLNS